MFVWGFVRLHLSNDQFILKGFIFWLCGVPVLQFCRFVWCRLLLLTVSFQTFLGSGYWWGLSFQCGSIIDFDMGNVVILFLSLIVFNHFLYFLVPLVLFKNLIRAATSWFSFSSIHRPSWFLDLLNLLHSLIVLWIFSDICFCFRYMVHHRLLDCCYYWIYCLNNFGFQLGTGHLVFP